MNKLKLLSIVPALCLASCSKNSFIGVYEFRLGKTDGAHFGLSVELKEDAYQSVEGMKQMQMVADLGDDLNFDEDDFEDSDSFINAKTIIKAFLDLIPEEDKENNRITIDGYYQLLPEVVNEKYGTRVKIGSDFLQNLVKKSYPDIAESIDISSIITPERIELAACAYVDQKQFTLQIPVSMEDLQHQLAWYGILFDLEAFNDANLSRVIINLDQDKLPNAKRGEDRIGSHPIQNESKGLHEVSDMNQAYEFDFSHTYLYQKDKDDIYQPTGSFVTKLNEKGEQKLFFDMFEGDIPPTVKGAIYVGSSYKEVEFYTVSSSKEVAGVNYSYPKDGDATITFKDSADNDVTVTFKEFVKKPFTFRDFHDVKVGLAKI